MKRPNDAQVGLWISAVLRGGVLLAAAVVIIGAVLYLVAHAGERLDFSHFHAVAAGLDSVHGVVRGVFAGDSQAVMQLGLLLLVATPVARVALSLVSFAAEHDWLYVVITLVVLGVLVASLFGNFIT
jgi:uncharacterized membrane protein